MRVKIVGLGHFVTHTRFKFEGSFAKGLKRRTLSDTSIQTRWRLLAPI
jgi:hypothetical protein